MEAGFEVIDPEETGLGEGMKSAAQKRKEKKERQKQKEDKKPEPPASTAAALAPVEAPKAVPAEAKTGESEVIIVGEEVCKLGTVL